LRSFSLVLTIEAMHRYVTLGTLMRRSVQVYGGPSLVPGLTRKPCQGETKEHPKDGFLFFFLVF
jgi:hypothetical protein